MSPVVPLSGASAGTPSPSVPLQQVSDSVSVSGSGSAPVPWCCNALIPRAACLAAWHAFCRLSYSSDAPLRLLDGALGDGVVELIEIDLPRRRNLGRALLRTTLGGVYRQIGGRPRGMPRLKDKHTGQLSGQRLLLLAQERSHVDNAVFAGPGELLDHTGKPIHDN